MTTAWLSNLIPAGRNDQRRSTSRCRAAARTAPSPGACSTICSTDERLEIEGISGASAGAMNAIMLADGLARGGPEEAQKRLADFWRAVEPRRQSAAAAARRGRAPAVVPAARRLAGASLARRDVALFSPYDVNPLNINPLSDVIERFVDFDAVRNCEALQLFIPATNVHTGRLHVFSREKITADAVMASACLPTAVSRGRDRRRALLGRRLSRQSGDLPVLPHDRHRGRAGGADQSAGAALDPDARRRRS